MFKKLVSNLPFTPQLINQVVFYTRRLARENATRRLAIVFAVAAMSVQIFSFVAPPEPSTAASTNDLIYGGIASYRPDITLLEIYDGANGGCDSLGRCGIRDVFNYFGISRDDIARSRTTEINSSMFVSSVGRHAHSGDIATHQIGPNTYHQRPLAVWGPNQTYRALGGTKSSDGKPFWVLLDCGNIVVTEVPSEPPPAPQHPKVQIIKDVEANRPVLIDESFEYKITVRNTGDVNLTNLKIGDILPPHITPTNPGILDYRPAERRVYFDIGTLRVGQSVNRNFKAKATANVALDKDLENVACVTTDTVPGAVLCDNAMIKIRKEGVPELAKQVANLTRQPNHAEYLDANGSTIHAGEVLEYSLTVKNPGTIAINNYIVTDDIRDILEYSDVVDAGGGNVQDGKISWAALSLKPNETIAKKFKVKLKSPAPLTPASVSDPHSFDMCLDNVFGDQSTTLCIDKPVIKQVEGAVSQLPNTGVSLNIVLTSLFVLFASYFFMRNRQLIRELTILKKHYNQQGN